MGTEIIDELNQFIEKIPVSKEFRKLYLKGEKAFTRKKTLFPRGGNVAY